MAYPVTRREIVRVLATTAAVGRSAVAVSAGHDGFEGRMISAGDNRPRLAMSDGYDDLLVELHRRTPIDRLPALLHLDSNEITVRLDALIR